MELTKTLRSRTFSWLALFILLALVPVIFTKPYFHTLATYILLYAVIVMGFTLMHGYAGQLNLAVVAFFGIGGYVAAGLTTRFFDFPFLVAVIVAVLATGTLGYLIGFSMLRLKGFYFVIATLAFGEIYIILAVQLDKLTGGPDGYSGLPKPSIAGFTFDTTTSMFYFMLVTFIICFIVAQNVVNSRVGRALQSIKGSELAAIACGVSMVRYKTIIFAISAAYAGLAGAILVHWLRYISPEVFVFYMVIEIIAMHVVGGVASIGGALVGAGVLRIVPEFVKAYPEYYFVLYGAIMILTMVFMPRGLWPSIVDAIRYRRNPLEIPELYRRRKRRATEGQDRGMRGEV